MRRNDWPERLARALEDARARTFSDTDYCVLFAADCIEAMTGIDHAADYRGLSIDEAKERFKAEETTLYRRLVSLFGKPIPLSLAQRGDLVICHESAAGICCGQMTAFLAIGGGLAFLPTRKQRWAFRVR